MSDIQRPGNRGEAFQGCRGGWSRSLARVSVATAAALVVGVILGAFDAGLAAWWPWTSSSLANSGGAWVLMSFLVALTARSAWRAVAQGLACLVGLVVGFYVVSSLQTLPPSAGMASFWVVVAVVLGPLVGLAAASVRFGPKRRAAYAVIGVGALVVLDALLQGHFSSVGVYWYAQAAVGFCLMVGPPAVLVTRAHAARAST